VKKQFAFYFGGEFTSYIDDSLHGFSQKEIMQLPGYKEFCQQNSCQKLVILEQVHGNKGYAILEEKDTYVKPYSFDGDYIVSKLPHIALAIETADCVPLLLVDTVNRCCAAVHAGWRGTATGVVTAAVQDMLNLGSSLENIHAYFGPAARGCCYEVTEEFLLNFKDTESFFKRDGKIFFDNTAYLVEQLRSLGIPSENISLENAVCTICSQTYCSFRRQGALNLRQMSIITLLEK
jgi:YfiH family protein